MRVGLWVIGQSTQMGTHAHLMELKVEIEKEGSQNSHTKNKNIEDF